MKLCDVNIFVNAHRGENPGHSFYHAWLTGLLSGPDTFLFCEWVLSAFLRIVTHPKIYKTPTPLPIAVDFVEQIRRCPFAINIMPGRRHWTIFETLIRRTNAAGNLMPDAYLAALAIEARAEWVSADEDFAGFEPELNWRLLLP